MLGLVLIDFAGGLLPVIGDVFDVFYRANLKIVHVLRRDLRAQVAARR